MEQIEVRHEEGPPPRACEIDAALHQAQVTRDKRQVRTCVPIESLPDGTFISLVETSDQAWLIWEGSLHRWSHSGYSDHRPLQRVGQVVVITPMPTGRCSRLIIDPLSTPQQP